MKIAPINSEKSRYGLKVPKVEAPDLKKIKEYPREESEKRLYDEFAKQIGEKAVRTTADEDEKQHLVNQPAPGHRLDKRV